MNDQAAELDTERLMDWFNKDPEMRYAEVMVGESLRWHVRLRQLSADDLDDVVMVKREAGTLADALRAAIDALPEGE